MEWDVLCNSPYYVMGVSKPRMYGRDAHLRYTIDNENVVVIELPFSFLKFRSNSGLGYCLGFDTISSILFVDTIVDSRWAERILYSS